MEENGHYVGQTAAKLIDKFQPTWGDTQLGLQYGIALTKLQRQFRGRDGVPTYKRGERVPLVVFFRNTSDKPIKFDTAPDFFGNTPKVLNAKGEPIALENIPLLGHIPHYHEQLAPGEALGPFYLNFGLGENPRPGQQHWHPYFKTPVAGQYKLTHSVSINVADLKDGERSQRQNITTGQIEFEIADAGKGAAAASIKEKVGSGLIPGHFGGAGQVMRIGPDGSISYGTNLVLCQMTLFEDERLQIAFHNERQIWTDVTLPLVAGANTRTLATWSAEIEGHTYQVTATPYSPRGCVYRLEKRLNGQLIHGSQQFFATEIRLTKGTRADGRTAPLPASIDLREWRVDQSGTGVVAGRYTGAKQVMLIAADGSISYSDRPHEICHLAVLQDDRLKATFLNKDGKPTEVTLPLVTTAAQHRASWSAEIDGHTLRATAVPYSDNVYVLQLEKLLNGKRIEGSQEFYAIPASYSSKIP